MTKKRLYVYEGKTFEATITYKKMRHIIMKADVPSLKITLSCPRLTSDKSLDDMVKRYLPKFIKKNESVELPYKNGILYYLGKPIEVGELTQSEVDKTLKKNGLEVITERVRHYECEMGILKHYNVRLRRMKTRFGTNSRKTHSLTFQLQLLHFPVEIIDTVVVHELAHNFQFNHSKKFYDVVYRYCPNYDKLHKRLRKGMFHE